jgi:hypothetical protein
MNTNGERIPESFQLAASGPNLYVNLPDLRQIAVVNRSTHSITRWPISCESNFPVAWDEPDHRPFVAMRTPPRLLVLDSRSGRLVATLPTVQDADDLHYDPNPQARICPRWRRLHPVFQQDDADHYELRAKVQTAIGARTAGYFGRGQERLRPFLPWRFPLAPTMAPKFGSIPCRTRA